MTNTKINLETTMRSLSQRHRDALQWFKNRSGTEQPWPAPLPDGTLLVTKAKGIYKPEWMDYALSVRQTLRTDYPDREPLIHPDGTWSYQYHQEGSSIDDLHSLYTNRALLNCQRDKIPVGVMRQTKAKPGVRYQILGLAIVAKWDSGYFFLEGWSKSEDALELNSTADVHELLDLVHEDLEARGEFDPSSVESARRRVLRSVVYRQGSAKFRATLLQIYGGRCAVTGCDVVEVLEAAHVTPYMGEETNSPQNGILLRADIHTLWDLGLIAIDENSRTLLVSAQLRGTSYGELGGTLIELPRDEKLAPSRAALQAQRAWSGL